MSYIKHILKLLIIVQLLACAFATYGHPDAEFVDFGSPSQPSRDQLTIEAAIKRGMDGEAVAELLRTRIPVVRTITTPTGFTKTTTYKLEPDGSISSNSILQKRNRYVFNSGAIPDDLKSSPTGGENTNVQSWSSEPETPFPLTNNAPNLRRTSTQAYITPNGEKYFVQTTFTNTDAFGVNRNSKFPSIDDSNWPSSDKSEISPFFNNMGTAGDSADDGWEVIDDPQATTKKTNKSWTTTTTKAMTTTIPTPTTRRNWPSLDEFLRGQYEAPADRDPKTYAYTRKYETTTTPKTSTTTPKSIKIEDLPVVEILHNGKPADESFLKTLPAHLTPRTAPIGTVLSVEHKHPVAADVDSYTPKAETNVRSYSTTHIGPDKPRLRDLDPQIQDILKNAGIVPEIEGDTVSKTRTESDGRVITTTYKVNTVPSAHHRQLNYKSIPFVINPITEFLSHLGLTRSDLMSRNGTYSQSFTDLNGDMLVSTLELIPNPNRSAFRK